MTNSPPQAPPQTDPTLIDGASLDVVDAGDDELAIEELYGQIGYLADALADADAEIQRLRGIQTVESVKAQLLAPYAKGVFRFVVGYCAVVALMLVLAGFDATGFSLPETILGIIAGSTAVSVIGLIGMVITGLFGKSS